MHRKKNSLNFSDRYIWSVASAITAYLMSNYASHDSCAKNRLLLTLCNVFCFCLLVLHVTPVSLGLIGAHGTDVRVWI